MADKKYSWIKLQEDFFRDKRIRKMRKDPEGNAYVIIYLEMQLLALETDGIIEYSEIEDSFAEELALSLNEDPEDVEAALKYLLKYDLVIELEDNKYLLPATVENTGKSDDSSDRVKAYRERKKTRNDSVTECNVTCNDSVTECNVTCNDDVTECNALEKRREEIDKSRVESDKSESESREEECIVGQPDVVEIIDYLNAKLGTDYKASTGKTKRLIHARLEEGFTVDDFKTVIDKKSEQWLHEPEMARYLRPDTLFSNKFEGYLNEIRGNPGGLERVQAWLRQRKNSS